MSTSSALDRVLAPARPRWRGWRSRTFPRHERTNLTLPVHYWLDAAKWSGVLMFAMGVIYLLETFVLGLKGTRLRMVPDPSEMAVRFFGLSHYAVATYMLLSSKKLRNLRGLFMLALFSLLALAACLLFYSLGGRANTIAVIGVFFFFLMHALRDEVFFYRMRSGKAISDEEYPHVYRMLIWLQVGGICLLAAILYPAFIYKLDGAAKHAALTTWINTIYPAEWPLGWKMAAASAPFFAVAVFSVVKIQRNHRGGLVNLLLSHTPLSVIVGGTVALALSSIFVGGWILNFVILIHFTGWFIFTTAGIARQPKEVQQAATWRQPNQWIRQNMLGFWVFHGGLAALFLAIIALNHYGLAQRPMTIGGETLANPLTMLFSANSLFYWTITHCTLGFLPKPAAKRR